jgi:CubicO group peptidase (beta-lactamase class C family)
VDPEVVVFRRRSVGAALAGALSALLTMTSAAATVRAAPPREDDGVDAVIARYRSTIPHLMDEADVPGLSLAVVDGNGVVWQQGFGTTDRGGGTPVTVDTIFSVQSMSKVFTATAVMQAVQAGRLDLDEPITTYLPDFTVHSAFEAHPERRITLRMLLGCTAGFTHEAPVGNNYEPEAHDFHAHVRSISDTWLRFPAGTGYAYSNLGFDLAARILEQVSDAPFPDVVRDSLLSPLGMDRSTFDRTLVRAADNRAVGHSGSVTQPVDSPMTGAGGLWASAADLARFLRFQLGAGTVDGRTLLDGALMEQMRTVPEPRAAAPAGYALGVARSRWREGKYLDLFSHGGGGLGFLSDMYWVPDLQLGVAVLTNADDHDLQSTIALDLLRDLATEPGSAYHDRFLALPAREDVPEPDGRFVAPPLLPALVNDLAVPYSRQQAARWAAYPEYYRAGRRGAMDPSDPPSRFHVEYGVPHFDAGEDGKLVSHRLTEVRPGLFVADDGETLDLRTGSRQWRGLHLHPVTNGPRPWQWTLLAIVATVAAGWLLTTPVVRRRRARAGRTTAADPPAKGRVGRRLAAVVATTAALGALVTVVAIRLLPALVEVGFLGWFGFPLGFRLALHLPLLVVALAVALAALLVVGAVRHWWTQRVRAPDAALAVAMVALAAQLVAWHLVGWGF